MPQALYRNRELDLTRRHFINSYPPFNIARQSGRSVLERNRDFALYVHIPFCPAICTYCFYKKFGNPAQSETDRYLSFLEREIELFSRLPGVRDRVVKTLYIGGGTPTALNCDQLRRLVSKLRRCKKKSTTPQMSSTAQAFQEISNAWRKIQYGT